MEALKGDLILKRAVLTVTVKGESVIPYDSRRSDERGRAVGNTFSRPLELRPQV